ncbi:hypothetical protein AMJ57_05635 [Parcubacteria bacterium SG8_24]|nr:MAG: hypothetical protein AMJ57_05635 [Parcubacteria bacterium SG8_24]
MGRDEIPHITCEHLATLKKGELEHVVVDLRDRVEFESGHILGSLNIPRHELEKNIDSLIPDKELKVVVIVGPTHESAIEDIHEKLHGLGYRNVEFLAGGFDRWCEIAPLEVDELAEEKTPEELGFVSDGVDEEIDPHTAQDEPMF